MSSNKTLFLGNSHTYMNDMPQLFREICRRTTGQDVEASMLAYSGRPLAWHLSEYFSLRFALLYGGYDFCVIQQQAHPFPPTEETLRDGKAVAELCRQAGARPVFYMTWAEQVKPENQLSMSETYRRLASETGALLAPVGDAWQKVLRDRPDAPLYFRDGEHASPLGDLLAASVLARTILGTKDLTLPDYMLDFRLDVSDPAHLSASMDPEVIRVPLDPEWARIILEALG